MTDRMLGDRIHFGKGLPVSALGFEDRVVSKAAVAGGFEGDSPFDHTVSDDLVATRDRQQRNRAESGSAF